MEAGKKFAGYLAVVAAGAGCALLVVLLERFQVRAAGGAEALRALLGRIPFADAQTAPLLRALLTGDRSGLGREVTASFRAAGASHLLALSGLHLGFIYAALSRILALPGTFPAVRTARSLLVCALCLGYTLMTGASPSTVRALLFILLREASRLLPGRRLSGGQTLARALLIQLAVRPSVALSPGFQLSYLAMLGIFWVYPWLRDCFPAGERFNPMQWLWDRAALTLACQLTTAPLSWLYFRSLPPHFLLANLLALPLTEALLTAAAGCAALTAAGWCPPAAVRACDTIARALVSTLETIASMGR